MREKYSMEKNFASCANIFILSGGKNLREDPIIKIKRMIWLAFTNLKGERALEIRSSILSQNSCQPDYTAAQGWFSTIESQ